MNRGRARQAEDVGIPLRCVPGGAFGPSATDTDLICLYHGWSYLTTSAAGSMPREPLSAFTAFGTRLVTGYRFRVNGRPPNTTLAAQTGSSEWSALFAIRPETRRRKSGRGGRLPRANVGLRILRNVRDGWTETFRLEGYGTVPRRVVLEIDWSCPVDDVEIVRAMRRNDPAGAHRAGLIPKLSRSGEVWRLACGREFGPRVRAPTRELRRLLGDDTPRDGGRVTRGLGVSIARSGSARAKVRVKAGRISRVRASMSLSKGESFVLELRFSPEVDGLSLPAPSSTRQRPVPHPSDASEGRTEIASGNPTFDLALRQAEADLDTLELGLSGPERAGRGAGRVMIGGLPRYVGIFTRDGLIAAHHAALRSSAPLEEAIARTAAYQGVRTDPWRDEEPGRLHHERRLNPESSSGRGNRELYYGDTLGTPYWIHALAEAFRWSGDRSLLVRHAGTLRRALAWILAKLGEGRGLLYYRTASPQGNRNQGWKDSDDAIVDGRGRVLEPPLATVELQGYAYLALHEAAWIQDILGESLEAARLREAAAKLKRLFDERFWDPRLRYFALAVDAEGRRADSISSNPAHCLVTGIVARSREAPLISRLREESLFSGWGVRTLSSANPSYDPFSYHRGAVWPVDNAFVARNLRRAGEDAFARRVIGAQFAAATCLPRMRLPETLSGHPRSPEDPTPGLYPDSNLVQAWSVTAVFSFVQTLLGIRPRADRRILLVDPDLPRWLPWIELRGLRVGGSALDLRFWRDRRGRSRWELFSRAPGFRVARRPWSLDPGPGGNPRGGNGSPR